MTTENIKVGDVYKNYPALCEALGIEAKTSNSKKKQLQEIEAILKYKREGNKYIIEELYDQKRIVIPSSVAPSKKRRGKHPLNFTILSMKKNTICLPMKRVSA